ncbi:glutathione S-transferase family protein [Hyalangium gracile]|uniref:glutathione S-transferase family protein n=1 Tax=Hyalangium gracile TaxID=394092 RepID=UPI001CCD232E|nr:glutathione S-transferase family protein [Hyalangium gracile]
MAIKLFDAEKSPNARKVRLVAAELGIPLERVPVSIPKGENRSSDYLSKNPNAKIPTIDDDGFVLWESAAILKYLASKRPEKGLVPADAKSQALLDQWLLWWTAHPGPAVMSLALEKFIKPFLGMPGNDATLIRDAEATLGRFLPVLDQHLQGKEYVLGKLSIVDFVVCAELELGAGVGVDIARYPNLSALMARMQARPYWKEA